LPAQPDLGWKKEKSENNLAPSSYITLGGWEKYSFSSRSRGERNGMMLDVIDLDAAQNKASAEEGQKLLDLARRSCEVREYD